MTSRSHFPKKTKPVHPMQPIVMVDGIKRFRSNAICRWLVDTGRANLNEIALKEFDDEDQAQFAQLIGYSVSGWGDLSYVDPEAVAIADRKRAITPAPAPTRRKK